MTALRRLRLNRVSLHVAVALHYIALISCDADHCPLVYPFTTMISKEGLAPCWRRAIMYVRYEISCPFHGKPETLQIPDYYAEQGFEGEVQCGGGMV